MSVVVFDNHYLCINCGPYVILLLFVLQPDKICFLFPGVKGRTTKIIYHCFMMVLFLVVSFHFVLLTNSPSCLLKLSKKTEVEQNILILAYY